MGIICRTRVMCGSHIMLRDLLTQKCAQKKRFLISDTLEHVESEYIKLKIGHRSAQIFMRASRGAGWGVTPPPPPMYGLGKGLRVLREI
jgi:hypothetical protein